MQPRREAFGECFQMLVDKPRGKAPCGKDGQPCSWDTLHGCWLEADGSRHVQRTNADVLKAGRKRVAEAVAAGSENAKRVREAERRRSCEKRRGPSGVFRLAAFPSCGIILLEQFASSPSALSPSAPSPRRLHPHRVVCTLAPSPTPSPLAPLQSSTAPTLTV